MGQPPLNTGAAAPVRSVLCSVDLTAGCRTSLYCCYMALSISRKGSALASKRRRTIKWWCVHRAATLSVLALTIASTRATENDISREIEATATSRLENARESNSNSNSNKPFFIQDPSDGLCLSGGAFKRCAVDTLWKVEGEAGRHSVRRLAVLEDGESYKYYGYVSCCSRASTYFWYTYHSLPRSVACLPGLCLLAPVPRACRSDRDITRIVDVAFCRGSLERQKLLTRGVLLNVKFEK